MTTGTNRTSTQNVHIRVHACEQASSHTAKDRCCGIPAIESRLDIDCVAPATEFPSVPTPHDIFAGASSSIAIKISSSDMISAEAFLCQDRWGWSSGGTLPCLVSLDGADCALPVMAGSGPCASWRWIDPCPRRSGCCGLFEASSLPFWLESIIKSSSDMTCVLS